MQLFFTTPYLFWYGFVFAFLFSTATCAVIQCWFLINFCGAKSRLRDYFIYVVISYGSFLFSILCPISFSPLLDTLIGVSIVFVFTNQLLKQNYTLSAIAAALTMAGTTLGESVMFLFEYYSCQSTAFDSIDVIIPIINQLLFLVLLLVIFRFFITRYSVKSRYQSKYLLAFALPIYFIAVVQRTLNNLRYTMGTDGIILQSDRIQNYEVILLTIGAFLCVCMVLFAYEKMVQQVDRDNRELLLHAQIVAQKNYVAEARQKYQATKIFRHDLKNHIIALKALIQLGDLEKVAAYLERFAQIGQDITFPINTGNPVIDTLLGEKFSYGERLGIEIKCEVAIPSWVNIDDFDLCTIFANAIDNAIRNCNAVQGDKKEIDLVAKPQKKFFVIDLVNNYQAETVVKGSGLGLTAIQMIVEKHHGAVEIFDADNLFRLSVILPFDQ